MNKETGVINKVTAVEKKSGVKEEVREIITETKDQKTGEVKVVTNKSTYETPVGAAKASLGTTVSTLTKRAGIEKEVTLEMNAKGEVTKDIVKTVALDGKIEKVTEETKADGTKEKVTENQANENTEVTKVTETTKTDGTKETKREKTAKLSVEKKPFEKPKVVVPEPKTVE